jgi:hypothetical protein
MLMRNFFDAHMTTTSVNRAMEEISWPAMILSNLAAGFLYATIIKWANAGTASAGAKAIAIVALLMSASIDFTLYGTMNIWTFTYTIGDIICWTIMSAIAGAVIGTVMGSKQGKV